jgi:hypothetical protein
MKLLKDRTKVNSSPGVQMYLRNLQWRTEFLQKYEVRYVEEGTLLHDTLTEGRVFGLELYPGNWFVPAFQVTEAGLPNLGISEILVNLRERGLDGWELAGWFTSPTGWLGDKTPLEVLPENKAEVIKAAGMTLY